MGEKVEILAALDGVNLILRRRAFLAGTRFDLWRLPKKDREIAIYIVDFILATGAPPRVDDLKVIYSGVHKWRLEFCLGVALIRLNGRMLKFMEKYEC